MNPISKYWIFNRQTYVRKLLKKTNSKILDIGCGEHKILSNAIGLDIFPYDGVDKIGSAEKLPFPKNSFDIVTMLEVIEHLKDPDNVLQEINRVLKKNGKVIISTPNVTHTWEIIWWVWSHTFGRKWKDSHVNEFNHNNFASLLNKYFKVIYLDKVNIWILVAEAQKIK